MNRQPLLPRLSFAFVFCAALATDACGGIAEAPLNVTVSIDTAVPHQTLAGFGAAVAYQPYLLSGRAADDDIWRVLFVDSGLDILRLGNWYQNKPSTNTSSTTPFGDSDQAQIVQKAIAVRGGLPPTILMSAWSPPSYLKSNGMTRPAYGAGATATPGTLIQRDGAYAYADYADWWVRSLQAYAVQGVVPDYISIQNEPDFYTRGWETCLWGTAEDAMMEGIATAGYGEAVDAVYNAIAASDLASRPVMVGPETTGFRDNIVQKYLPGLNPAQLGAVAHHLYGTTEDNPNPDWFNTPMRDIAAAASALGLPTFMTEYSPNVPTMFDTAWLINNALTVEGVSAYIWWELIWSPSPPTGLVTISNSSPSSPYAINDTYYALKHFARWTDPGWVRVEATSSLAAVRTSAFVSPDGRSLTLVMLNTGGMDHMVAVNPGAFSFGTFAIYRTSGASERSANVAPESDGSILLPSRAIATVTYTP